ncbi:hypothetical protein [Bradyrhizobium diazoefficiens]|uniref:Blr8006 protein n=2 Tax=Bradyrhizobium diazoefficiens TaxID=1355477 RepID=A0A810CK77_9BRAD|nr:hypothetical protein [Bradyrhizobium diazoefficiens]QLD45927.1 hypothetical protein HUW42_35250 [Bradyrhizobium diazoefficiens]WLA72261.1 hypothetical protein QIH77_36075 [Bradyrhizobium diazoefficiens]BCE19794.1 hypothetical protein XF1B_24750 [Bradyrhizobium diazoefficiens]BCE89572.1 hypothetical protein XF10B_23700 [Bradyrhizobium diazoefficiens]BCF24512.1 hypothetical protein XF14B_24640 [Bradyrhizobium diazoefficiens]
MTDRPASSRMPTPKQMAAVGKNAPGQPIGPDDDLPAEYWEALLRDAPADDRRSGAGLRMRRLADLPQHVLRVSCRRCGRIVEVQKADAARLYGPQVLWKDVGQRLLDNTCQVRTGRHEEDGCWPAFE